MDYKWRLEMVYGPYSLVGASLATRLSLMKGGAGEGPEARYTCHGLPWVGNADQFRSKSPSSPVATLETQDSLQYNHTRQHSYASEVSSVDGDRFIEYSVPSPSMDGPPSVDIITNALETRSIADRFNALGEYERDHFSTCGNDSKVQLSVLAILESPQFKANEAVPFHLLSPLFSMGPKGVRGAPQWYMCKWGSCRNKLTRKLHAREHMMTHVHNRPYACPKWYALNLVLCIPLLMNPFSGATFVRKNELKKHRTPCEKNSHVRSVMYCHFFIMLTVW